MRPVTLTKPGVGAALIRLSRQQGPDSSALYARIMNSWGSRIDRERVTIKLNAEELELFESLKLPPTLVECPRWVAVYRDSENGQEVTVRTQDRPTKRRAFRIHGGRSKMTLVSLTDLTTVRSTNHNAEEATKMAKTSTRTRKTKQKDEDLEELEGLEELDDLEDVEPDDEDEVEEEPKPKAKRSRSRKAKATPEPDEDEDDEEEDEEPAPKAKRSRKAKAKDEKPAKAKSKRTPPTPPNRELPTGKLGPTDIAELAGVSGRDVRQYLRKQGIAKDEELGRYAFTKKEATSIAKKIKAASK